MPPVSLLRCICLATLGDPADSDLSILPPVLKPSVAPYDLQDESQTSPPQSLLLRPRQPLDLSPPAFWNCWVLSGISAFLAATPCPLYHPRNSCASFDTQLRCHCFGEVFPDLPKTEVMSPIPTSAAMLPFSLPPSLDVRSLKAEDLGVLVTQPGTRLCTESPPGTSIT